MDRIRAIRNIIPEASISTDIIAGFSGETEEDHKETLSLMEWAGFDFAYMFKYSERPGTQAEKKYPDDVPEIEKTRRLNEIIEFKPDHTDDYVVVVENDPRQSEAEYPCKLVVLEEISANKEQKAYIEGAINDDGEWDPQLNTDYAFLFDAREQTNKTFDVTLSTPKQVDMYQMRLYKRPVKEVRVGSEYDALDPFSEYALLTDDAPTVGDDLQFSFYITTQSGTEMREKSRFFSDYFIIELIGERGDGTCELLIKEVIEESAGEPENEVENPPEETPPEENTPEENAPEQSTPEEETPSSFKELTLIQKITGGGILIAFVVVCGLFVYILIKR